MPYVFMHSIGARHITRRARGASVMEDFSRRTFFAVSAGALVTLGAPRAVAGAECVSGLLPSFLPTRLSVDCASRRNFQLFRQNDAYLGLAGTVSMTFVRGKIG